MDETEKEKHREDKPSIEASKDGPYIVRNLKKLENSKGKAIDTKPLMALCRCGQSSTKPFCDGSHAESGFTGGKAEARVPDRMDDYEEKEVTIHDNRGVCAHRGHCTDNLPHVFRMRKNPWIDPDAEDSEKIARVIEMCPSGALSYTKDRILHKDFGRETKMVVSKDGPYDIEGTIEFKDHEENRPESQEHYTLCRCGGSKNKPFCDGTHWHIDFKDEKN